MVLAEHVLTMAPQLDLVGGLLAGTLLVLTWPVDLRMDDVVKSFSVLLDLIQNLVSCPFVLEDILIVLRNVLGHLQKPVDCF